jgi:uncharacterized protein YigA (DUF484 family)
MDKFELTMELVRYNLDDLKREIKLLYEEGAENYKKIHKLMKDTEFLLNSVNPESEDEELLDSELRYELRSITADYYDIYYALN